MEVESRPWLVLGLAVALLLLLGAGIVRLALGPDVPALPFVPVDRVKVVESAVLDINRGILFVRAGRDDVRAFAVEEGESLEREGDQLVDEQGRRYDLRGLPTGGGEPLDEHPVIIYEDTIYIDLESTRPAGTDLEPQRRISSRTEPSS